MQKRHHPAAIFGICSALSFLFACTWVVVMTLTLPPTDLAHGQMPFQDPLVLPIMSMFAMFAATLVFPITHFAIRDRSLPLCVSVICVIVLLEIVAVTPLDAGLGFLGSFVAFGGSLLIVRHRAFAISANRHSQD